MATDLAANQSEELRSFLHRKLDQLDNRNLQLLHRVLRRLEVESLAAKISDRIDANPEILEKIDRTIAKFRREHPYNNKNQLRQTT